MKEPQRTMETSWEKYFEKVIQPIEEFIRYKASGAMLLFLCAVASFALVNSQFHDRFESILKAEISITGAGLFLHMSVHHWINDGLMALFFLLMGLEIKREILVGELSRPRQALLPILAAAGGMAAPAAIYLLFNPAPPNSLGWGVPMATDIAFSVGILYILGDRIPRPLFVFLISLAIVDDIGAVLVIALYYSHDINTGYIYLMAATLAALTVMNRIGVRSLIYYAIGGVILWTATLESGLHATIAGVLLAFAIPARPRKEPASFSDQARGLMARFDAARDEREDILINNEQRAIIFSLMVGARDALTPLQRMEHILHMPVSFLVMPLFALANAGVVMEADFLGQAWSHPITLGVTAGLLVGKVMGVFGVSALAVWSKIVDLPAGTTYRHLLGAGFLAGVGFTMSIFIAELAFASAHSLSLAKVGVLAGSAFSAVIGMILLSLGASPADKQSGD